MSLHDMEAEVHRLLVRERHRRVLGDDKREQLRLRLRRAAIADDARRGSRLRFWQRLMLRPVLVLGLLLLGTGAAVAIVTTQPAWLPEALRLRAPATARKTAALPQARPHVDEIPNDGAALRAEVALIGRARRALNAGKHDEAARVLSAHGQQFPAGALIEEREGLSVMVLWHRGQRREAVQAARRFERRYPQSPMNRPLRELVDASP